MKSWTLLLGALCACSRSSTEAPPSTLTSENFLEPAHLRESFQGMDRIFATRVVPRSGPAYELSPPTEPFDITYQTEGEPRGAEDLMATTDGTGLLILHGDSGPRRGREVGRRVGVRRLSGGPAREIRSAESEGKSGSSLVNSILPALRTKYGSWGFFDDFAIANLEQTARELSGNKRVPPPVKAGVP